MQEQRTQRRATDAAEARAELDMMTAQRAELQAQAAELGRRRNQLDEQRHVAPNAGARAALEARIGEIDARSARIDAQIQGLNDRIVEAMGRVGNAPVVVEPRITIPQISIPPINFPRQRGPDMREVGGIMAAEAVTLALIGLAFWRFGMRRMREQFERVFANQSNQLNQLQQAVDVIGVEVERISEGQRYVAKVLTEGAAVGVGTALGAGRKEAVPASRER